MSSIDIPLEAYLTIAAALFCIGVCVCVFRFHAPSGLLCVRASCVLVLCRLCACGRACVWACLCFPLVLWLVLSSGWAHVASLAVSRVLVSRLCLLCASSSLCPHLPSAYSRVVMCVSLG